MRTIGTVAGALIAWCIAWAAPAAAHLGAEPPKDVYLAKRIAEVREATARYQDLQAALAGGYAQASGNLPLRGYRFVHPGITSFDFTRPSAFIYVRQGERWQLAGVEYDLTGDGRPTVEPFPGIPWSRQPAICRYADWHELESPSRDRCPPHHPEGAALAAWEPAHWFIRVWVWYPNPSGMFARLNPLLAPFDDRSLPPGGFATWDAWAEDAAFSNRNHHVAGWLVLAISALMFLPAFQVRQAPWLRPAWTVIAMIIGVLILIFSDPEGWPIGSLTLAQSLASEEVREHKLSGVIVLALAWVEFLRLRGRLAHPAWGSFLPILCIGAGVILSGHQHAVSNFSYLGRANIPHVTEGITVILAGLAKLLREWGLWRGRLASLAWPSLMLALALQLILYTE